MSGSTLSGNYNQTVTIGSGGYASPVVLTSAALVNPDVYGAAGVYAPANSPSFVISNYGSINGGYGGSGQFAGVGGTGVDLLSSGTLFNQGTISGGTGGGDYGRGGVFVGYTGGVGVDLAAGGYVNNSGSILGGKGGYSSYGYGGSGGLGVNLGSFGTLINNGTIAGGVGGNGVNGDTGKDYGGAGGIGVQVGAGAYLLNYGSITGGQGGAFHAPGGIGVSIASGGTVNNYGIISGGGVPAPFDGPAGDPGGIGVYLAPGGEVFNPGTIIGGGGSNAFYPSQGENGGAGVYLKGAGQLFNGGTILGGYGGDSSSNAGNGGTGVDARLGATLTNYGTIAGGSGGNNQGSGLGGRGGIGVSLAGGTVMNNLGVILGGGGGYSYTYGGDAVDISGATLTNAGTIEAGPGGPSADGSDGPPGYAVRFGAAAATLILDPGSVINGQVAAKTAVDDVLQLAGSTAGTLTGIGTQFTGFRTIDINAGATWTTTGSNSLASNTTLDIGGKLIDTGTLVTSGPVTVSGKLVIAGTGAALLRHGLSIQNGSTIADATTGRFEIGTAGSATKGLVTVDAGARLIGAGTVASGAADNGSIVAQGGTLAFLHNLSGTGTLEIGANASVSVGGTLSVSKLVFLAGGHETAMLGAPTLATATISGFTLKTDSIDLNNFVVTGRQFANHTLTLDRSGGSPAHLHFAGNYTIKSFAFASDHHGGTNITFV